MGVTDAEKDTGKKKRREVKSEEDDDTDIPSSNAQSGYADTPVR